mmetsp:Transcript_29222/g.76533  ORF Transcript_29222/g.76533 Transcript_29222/m.76533 type:complete len:406 (+) Transcript_29222:197-1414(+)
MVAAGLFRGRLARAVGGAAAAVTTWRMREHAAVAQSAATSEAAPSPLRLLSAAELNQPEGVPQSLAHWRALQHAGTSDYFVERVSADESKRERHLVPDAGNQVRGVPHPPFIREPEWTALAASGRIPKPGDVWVATFPKCGTTFTEQVVLLLLNGGDPAKLTPRTQNTYDRATGSGKVWVEQMVRVAETADDRADRFVGPRMQLTEFTALPSPRVLKTHAPRQLFLGVQPDSPECLTATGRPTPLDPSTKVIYVSREPKDACVSSYYHASNPHQRGFPFDAWAFAWLHGLFEHGRWSDHVAAWRAEARVNPRQVLWVRYEDLKADPVGQVRRIAAFLEVPVTDALISATVEHSGFAAMQRQSGGYRFFRKGQVGDWGRHFSPALAAEFDAQVAHQMRGAENPYSQ